jgi:hypothetical protein
MINQSSITNKIKQTQKSGEGGILGSKFISPTKVSTEEKISCIIGKRISSKDYGNTNEIPSYIKA